MLREKCALISASVWFFDLNSSPLVDVSSSHVLVEKDDRERGGQGGERGRVSAPGGERRETGKKQRTEGSAVSPGKAQVLLIQARGEGERAITSTSPPY